MSDLVEPTDEKRKLQELKQATIDNAPAHHKPALSMCEFRYMHYERQFAPVLVVDSPDKWQIAEAREATMLLNIPGSQQKMRFRMHGISLAEYERLEQQMPIPEWDEVGAKPTPEFSAAVDNIATNRSIYLIEKATGNKFPGETYDDKREWLYQRNEADVAALKVFIRLNLCNFSDKNAQIAQPLLRKYESDLEMQGSEIIEFKDFSDWKAAAEVQHVVRFQRFNDPYFMEFPLRSIGTDACNRILDETKEPIVPSVPVRDEVTGNFLKDRSQLNRHDATYLRKVRAAAQARAVKFMNACLMFTIPGANEKEQYDWLAQRLAGDVTRVKEFIEGTILGVEHRYDFFLDA